MGDDVIAATNQRQPPWHLLQVRNPACQQFLAACVDKTLQRRPRAPQVLGMPFFTNAGALPQMMSMPGRMVSAQPVTYAAPPATYASAPVTYAAPAPVTYAAPVTY